MEGLWTLMRRWFSQLGSSSATITRSNSPSANSLNSSQHSQSTNQIGRSSSFVPLPPSPPVGDIPIANLSADFASDPGCWEESFDSHWKQVKEIIDDVGEVTYEKIVAVFHHFGQMCQLFMMEMNAQPEPAIGPILDRYFTYQIMDRIVDWSMEAPQFLSSCCQVGLMRLYEAMVSESHTQNHCLLVHKPMLLPMIRVLEWCKRSAEKRNFTPSTIDRHFVMLLNQVCAKLAEDATLLHFFFTFGGDSDDQFLVFSLLIPYLYDPSDVGQLARDAVLLILSVSRKLNYVAAYISMKSNFCPVVATGLSGCFSQLPRNVGAILYVGEDWHKITSGDIEEYPSLSNFHMSLLFCNAVIQVAHEHVVSQVITYIYNGFLLPVVLPSLLQSGQEELISSTAYYHLCFEVATEKSLLHALIKLLLVEQSGTNRKIIEVIIDRISPGNKLSQVSLSLLHTLISLRCEDIMFDLVFKYLLPCTYIHSSQFPRLRERKYVLNAAKSLLSLIPECTLKSESLCSSSSIQCYTLEAHELVQTTADACSETWSWKYDARVPPAALFRTASDDESASDNNQQYFQRNISARSSMVSARNGLNRYFVSRTAHPTNESLMQQSPLPELGKPELSPLRFHDECEVQCSLPDDVDDFSFPPISPTCLLMTTSTDYFQFVYDGTSESETDNTASLRDGTSSSSNQMNNGNLQKRQDSATGAVDTDAEMARSFVLKGWNEVEDMETFMALLERVPTSTRTSHSLEENVALIDSRIQYLNELKAEREENISVEKPPDLGVNEEIKTEKSVVIGIPIQCSEHQGVGPLLESLLRSLDSMIDNSLSVNLHVTSLLALLSSYTHPLIASYFFDSDLEIQPGVKRLFKILTSLKARIDSFSSSVDGFDVLLERGVKFLTQKAEKYEKSLERSRFNRLWPTGDGKMGVDNSRDVEQSETLSNLFKFRPFSTIHRRSFPLDDGCTHPHAFRYFSHKAIESRDATLDSAKAKQVVFAAIILSQFCQELSAIVLQHATVVARPRRPTEPIFR